MAEYYRGMVDAFEGIAADPDGGRVRSLFAAGLRSVNYGRHVIFFARMAGAGDEPVIIHIVHQYVTFQFPCLTSPDQATAIGKRITYNIQRYCPPSDATDNARSKAKPRIASTIITR